MSPTRVDVARRAGVSVAVVSYVVNDGPRPVAAATRQRVLEAIEELGYRPDGIARQLRTGKSNSFGLIVPDLGLPHFGEMTQMLTRMTAQQHYQLLVASTEWNIETERAQLDLMADRRVDGVILMSVDPRQDTAWMEALRVPVVIVDRPTASIKGAEAAVEHLIWHGHHRIGFVTGSLAFVANQRKRAGWDRAMEAAGLTLEPDLVVPSESAGREGIRPRNTFSRMRILRPGCVSIPTPRRLASFGEPRISVSRCPRPSESSALRGRPWRGSLSRVLPRSRYHVRTSPPTPWQR